MPNAKELSHIPVLLIACVLLVVGVATNMWVSASETIPMLGKISMSKTMNRSLFWRCDEVRVHDSGGSLYSGTCGKTDDQHAPKGLVIAGIVIGGLVTLLMIAYIFLKNSNSNLKQIPIVCGIGGIIGVVLIIVGVVLFAIDYNKDGYSYGYSFYVTLAGACVLILGSVLSLIA